MGSHASATREASHQRCDCRWMKRLIFALNATSTSSPWMRRWMSLNSKMHGKRKLLSCDFLPVSQSMKSRPHSRYRAQRCSGSGPPPSYGYEADYLSNFGGANSVNQKAGSTTGRIKAIQGRWQRLENILADALEQNSLEERAALLKRLCADDTELLREAEKLLAHDTTAFEEFAEFGAKCLRHGQRDRIGERIGAYVIVRELRRGGSGFCYLPER